MQFLLDHIEAKISYYLSNLSIKSVLICYCIILISLIFLRTILGRKISDVTWLVWSILFDACFTVILAITLLGREPRIQQYNGGFSFFISLFHGVRIDYYDIAFNILMFIPFGLLLAIRLDTPWRIVFICALSIEFTQLVTRRGVFEVSDIMFNTLGGCIGIILVKVFYTIKHFLPQSLIPERKFNN